MKTYEEIEDEFFDKVYRFIKGEDEMKVAKAFGEYCRSVDKLLNRGNGGTREIVAPFKVAVLMKLAEDLSQVLDDDAKNIVSSNKGLLDRMITTVSFRGKMHNDE